MTSLLDEALEAWQYTRASLIAEVNNLSAADLTFRPTPESRSVADIVLHVVQTGLMMSGELSRPDGNFQRKSFPAFIKEYAADVKPSTRKGMLVRMLKRSHADGDKRIRKAGELHMLQRISRFDGEQGTRLAWMHHSVSHEEYHRGQVALYARLCGHVPALTQLILGKTAKS